MLTIRDAQLAALAAAAGESFERRLYAHAAGMYPNLLDRLGEGGLRDLIRFGIGECRKYGWRNAGDLVRFIEILSEACHSGAEPAEAARQAKLALSARDVFLKVKGLEGLHSR